MNKAKKEAVYNVLSKLRDGYSLSSSIESIKDAPTIPELNKMIDDGDKCELGFNLSKKISNMFNERPIAQLEKAIQELEDDGCDIESLDRVKIRLSISKLQYEFLKKNTSESQDFTSLSIEDIEKENKKHRSKFGV